jgi:hypothetical protein
MDFVLELDHWRLRRLLYGTGDYGQARDVAVRAAMEARKPRFDAHASRICLQEDLIAIYIGTDPDGNAALIRSALDHALYHLHE